MCFFVKAHRRFSPPPLDASPLPPVRNNQGATLLNMCRGTSSFTRSRRSRDDVFASLTHPPLRASPAPLVLAFTGSAWVAAPLGATSLGSAVVLKFMLPAGVPLDAC